MQHESPVGRNLWRIALIVVLAYTIGDFVGHPVIESTGDAAAVTRDLTLWMSETDSSGEAGIVASQAARALPRHGLRPDLKALPGSASAAVTRFFGPHGPNDPSLLVVSSTTLSDLAREREQTLIPTVTVQAGTAQGLLRHAVPIGVVSADQLVVAVGRRSPLRSVDELLDSVRAHPRSHVFALADDTWSRANFTALIDRAHSRPGPARPGHVPFTLSRSASALRAFASSGADVLMATRSTVLAAGRHRRLRILPWPDARTTPRSWVALVARPGTSVRTVARLRKLVGELIADPRWHRTLARDGRGPGNVGPSEIAAFMRGARGRADELQRITRLVEAQ